jgi:hypothetical protein
MLHRSSRGSALVTAMTVLVMVFVTGSGVLSLSLQAMRRGKYDTLRSRAIALAEAGADRAIMYVRTVAPDGTRNGTWRTMGLPGSLRVEQVLRADGSAEGSYEMQVVDGTGANAGKIQVTSTGRVREESTQREVARAIRVVLKLDMEDIGVWNNAIFGGVGQSGRSINGNVQIRGNVHLLGDGEPFTDSDLDNRWDAGETFIDTNLNGVYNVGEVYVDADGDGHRDAREPFEDVNGNGLRDPALTVTDLSSEFGGTSTVGNNYTGMPADLQNRLPALNPKTWNGEMVQTLDAKLRVKHGQVSISGTATVGTADVAAGSPMVKETLDGTFVSDGFTGTSGAASVYSDNGAAQKYNLGDFVKFPTLTDPCIVDGVSYASYMDYLQATSTVVAGPITIQKGTAFSRSGPNGSIDVDTAGNITISGKVYVDGNVTFAKNGPMYYTGKGSLVSSGSIFINESVNPQAVFPINNVMGFIARRRIELATGGGAAQIQLAGAYYAQEQIVSAKQNELAGTFVCSYFSMTNVPRMYQVPALSDNLPPGMPGSERLWIHSIRLDSWREISAS